MMYFFWIHGSMILAILLTLHDDTKRQKAQEQQAQSNTHNKE